jgi:hypothetical protein
VKLLLDEGADIEQRNVVGVQFMCCAMVWHMQ